MPKVHDNKSSAAPDAQAHGPVQAKSGKSSVAGLQGYEAQAAALSPQARANLADGKKGPAEAALERWVYTNCGSLVRRIEELAEECVFSDEEMFEVLRGMERFGSQAAGEMVAANLTPKAKEELVDNINTPHLNFRSTLLEIYFNSGKDLVGKWIDTDVLKAMPTAGMSAREQRQLGAVVYNLPADKKEDVLESANGKAIKKAMAGGKKYRSVANEVDAGKSLEKKLWPLIVADLRKSTFGARALGLIERNNVRIEWADSENSVVEPTADNKGVRAMIIGTQVSPHVIAQYIIHEAHHISEIVEGTTENASDEPDRTKYVRHMVGEETDATIESCRATMERGLGANSGIPDEDIYIRYYKAYQNGKGLSKEDAHKKARRKLFRHFMVKGGLGDKAYGVYYGELWDKTNPVTP